MFSLCQLLLRLLHCTYLCQSTCHQIHLWPIACVLQVGGVEGRLRP